MADAPLPHIHDSNEARRLKSEVRQVIEDVHDLQQAVDAAVADNTLRDQRDEEWVNVDVPAKPRRPSPQT